MKPHFVHLIKDSLEIKKIYIAFIVFYFSNSNFFNVKKPSTIFHKKIILPTEASIHQDMELK